MGSPEHDAAKPKAFTPHEVKDEALKLEKSASSALSNPDSMDALKAFHKDVAQLQSHGLDNVKQVFQQMQEDGKSLNPFLPNVQVTDTNGGMSGREVALLESRFAGGTLATFANAEGVHTINSRGHDGPTEDVKTQGNTSSWKDKHEFEIETKQKSGDK